MPSPATKNLQSGVPAIERVSHFDSDDVQGCLWRVHDDKQQLWTWGKGET